MLIEQLFAFISVMWGLIGSELAKTCFYVTFIFFH